MMDIVIEKFNEISKNYLIELISYTYEKDHVHLILKHNLKLKYLSL